MSDEGCSKKGKEARKEESIVGNSINKVEDDLIHGSGFHTHRVERYEKRPMRGLIRPHRNFDDLGDVDHNLGSIMLTIPTFKGKIDLKSYLD